MPELSKKHLLALAAIVVTILVGVSCFILFKRRDKIKGCKELLHEPLKDHLVKGVFKEFIGRYSDVWSSVEQPKNECAFFTMRPDGLAMVGFKNSSGDFISTYLQFVDGDDGTITIETENEPRNITGKIYPLYFNEYVLGNIMCTDTEDGPKWRSYISVDFDSLFHSKTPNLVSEALRVFGQLSEELGLPINHGEHYVQPCYEQPVWRDYTKNSSYK